MGLCEPGEQTAGFPSPFVRDDASQVGESPTSSWSVVDIRAIDLSDYIENVLSLLGENINILFCNNYL